MPNAGVRLADIPPRSCINAPYELSDEHNPEDVFLELRPEYVAMGRSLRADTGFYFLDAKKLVFQRRTTAWPAASKPLNRDLRCGRGSYWYRRR